MNKRIKKIRQELDLTQSEFAERIGSVQNTITGYETGRRVPSSQVISLICREFNVNETWLRTGEGEMFNAEPSDALDALVREYRLTPGVKILIEKLINMKQEHQDIIVRYVVEAANAMSSLSADGAEEESLPVFSVDMRKKWNEMSKEERLAEFERQLDAEEKGNAALSEPGAGSLKEA